LAHTKVTESEAREEKSVIDVVALGDVNVDIIAQFDRYPGKGDDALAYATEIHCGGSAANAAMALAGIGIKTSLISRVGPDSWALKALRCLEEAGVDPQSLQRDPSAMTGMMYVVVTPDGERTILGHRGANVNTDPNQIRERDLQQAKVFHLSGYSLLSEPQRSAGLLALEIACRHGLTVALDPGMTISQTALDEMQALLPVVNILLPNLREAQQMAGLKRPADCARALLDRGVQVVALKLGPEGCLVVSEAQSYHVPGFAIEARDSTGAGDCFAAGFIAGFLGDLGWRGAAVLGGVMGAMSASHVGGTSAVPDPDQVLTFLGECRHQMTHGEVQDEISQVVDYVHLLANEKEQ
jgi:ribokinase